ncbi:MAG: EamA family transporter [Ruminococcaceae bacterium]|nr:EamA family transporter [Oscillospiraceae bacterium]
MWLLFAAGSAFFAGITAILAKCGIRNTDSTVATAVRTIVVLIMSMMMVMIVGSAWTITEISGKTWLFLTLSGLATGASWLCYFRALQVGDVNKVVPVDKSSTVLAMLLALIFLHEEISLPKLIGLVAVACGIFLMIEKKESGTRAHGKGWLLFAVLSAVFAALTSILGKIGIDGVESNLGTAIRTTVVLVMAWVMVFVSGKAGEVRKIPRRELLFICLSGLATGASWLCYYKALQDGPASVVVPVDKLSILVSVLFSRAVFHEKLPKRAIIGLVLLTAGTVTMAVNWNLPALNQ